MARILFLTITDSEQIGRCFEQGAVMIQKYYNGAVEQVVAGLGKLANNSLLVRYSGDFSVQELDRVKQGGENAFFFAVHEFDYAKFTDGYEPYLSVICEMFRRYMTGTFEEFLEKCDVYMLHRPVLMSYFETGICRRREFVLLDEVEYEQERMEAGLERMLLALVEVCPLVILLNHFQYAPKSTMTLTKRLISGENKNIGIVIGVNDVQVIPEFLIPEWDALYERMDDGSRIYHIGNSGKKAEWMQEAKADKPCEHSEPEGNKRDGHQETEPDKQCEPQGKAANISETEYRKLKNMVELLDFEQAVWLIGKIERRVKFENVLLEEKNRFRIWTLFAWASIMTKDLSKALEICEELEKIRLPGEEAHCGFVHAYLVGLAYMYQGKLTEALGYAKRAYQYGKDMGEEYRIFLAELLEIQIQMSGWYNIFFCVQDISVSETLLEKLNQYQFYNYLSHIYIYAYDNKPEMVAKAYRSEEFLRYFSKGIRIAKQIGNEQLVNTAYQKNIMIASTNGMYEISLLYAIRTYESLKDSESVAAGRIYSGIAYSLCAMGENERAEYYYNHAIRVLYRLRKPEDIAEVQYNMALNAIMCENYATAERYLLQCMKAVEKLHLNSLRVCNLSKLYGLLALVTILEGNHFNCERYLYNCRQFLNYVLEKEQFGNELGIVHDYAKVDDDMFLFSFASALLAEDDGNHEHALMLYEQANKYLEKAEGNQFFSYALFRRCRMKCYAALGKEHRYEEEAAMLQQYETVQRGAFKGIAENMIKAVPQLAAIVEEKKEPVSMQKLDELIWQESMVRAYKSKKRQLDFISTWQKLIDITGVSATEMMDTVMKTFLNHFNIDCAVYVRYIERQPQVLYNNTGIQLTQECLQQIEHAFSRGVGGFAISKISSNYAEHQDMAAVFGEDEVCSMVAIPFYDNAKIESFLIAYVRMKDNWHSSVNRYMLDEDDVNVYQLLFREVRYSLNRLEAYDRIYEMNTKLYLSAVTDQLTGIYNREGFYRKLDSLLEEFSRGERTPELGLMFVDLDNFKHYNDTFGHDVGDLILQQMAKIFTGISSGRGFVCRYGGDEFIIVLYTADKTVLQELAQEIYRKLEQTDGFAGEISEKIGHTVSISREQQISCSIGIAVRQHITDECMINEMIKQADALLYEIKTSTKGNYRI